MVFVKQYIKSAAPELFSIQFSPGCPRLNQRTDRCGYTLALKMKLLQTKSLRNEVPGDREGSFRDNYIPKLRVRPENMRFAFAKASANEGCRVALCASDRLVLIFFFLF